jgi:hypothetical protein
MADKTEENVGTITTDLRVSLAIANVAQIYTEAVLNLIERHGGDLDAIIAEASRSYDKAAPRQMVQEMILRLSRQGAR